MKELEKNKVQGHIEEMRRISKSMHILMRNTHYGESVMDYHDALNDLEKLIAKLDDMVNYDERR